jgi:hypothetical protein
MAAPFDRTKFIKIAAMLGSSHEGERRAAADQAARLLLAAPVDTRWPEVFGADPEALREALRQAEVREEACRHLLTQLEERDARITELERAQPDWHQITSVPIGHFSRTARWILDLDAQGQIRLTSWESTFVKNCASWFGQPRGNQQPKLQDIVNRIYHQTGLRPPP